ncbi:tetratricopeptide repeat protein [Dethiobacter alkaliphilus]|uniref:Tetratricopeptide TPR_2 repeat protein n=1 Tax=Dethiobacter alkaliphilus AHT 1 TaxID=555088 RepID=C0GF24_DETAL|nr:tetratricopeptide repeat protein [Dethiobacter alkaliphilus]EEG78206.1 Tetratricopeptide TPR_2 repeat protein [Dethiobacter alkaliphilus AHT 1]
MKDVGQKKETGGVLIHGNIVPFEQDAGFYLQKGMFYYQKNKPDKALRFFQRAVAAEPDNAFNHYNLACMLSKLGRLKEANRIFLHIIAELDDTLGDCYFLLGINYGLLEDMDKSREYLIRYLQAEPDGEMSFEAMELLDALDEDGSLEELSPNYVERDLFLDRVLETGSTEELVQLFNSNKGFRKALANRLYHESDEFKEEILHFYGKIGGDAACKVLRRFVKNPWIKERFRQLALLELKNMGYDGKVQTFQEGRITELDLDNYAFNMPVWKKEWQQVVDCAMQNMRKSNCYEDGFFEDIQAIWLDYINTVYPETPRIVKVETWAAALEYSLARFHFLSLTQKELADEYKVSSSSISSRFREINKALDLDEKAHRNMMAYLRSDFLK